jgi:transcriptional regulator with XRE-family HTH domain
MSRLPRAFLRPVGEKVRELRTARGLTLEGLAEATRLSKGLLSKIENFRTAPSLPVLATIARALECDLADLVAEVQTSTPRPYVLVRADESRAVRRESAHGFRYAALQSADCAGLQFQAFRLRLSAGAHREVHATDGDEFLIILSGAVRLTIGDEELALATGDSLYFDGRIPHAPANPGDSDAELLVIYLVPGMGPPRPGRPRKGSVRATR